MGIESYYASRAFTMSLGGIRAPPSATRYGFGRPDDKGVAMPTSIIPTIAGRTIDDVFSFQGVGTQEKRSENLCGWKGFICGINPQIPLGLYHNCTDIVPGVDNFAQNVNYYFVNSATCFPDMAGPHFFLAAKAFNCINADCNNRADYGLMEIVERPDLDVTNPEAKAKSKAASDDEFRAFVSDRTVALSASSPDGPGGNGGYQTTAGDNIFYQIKQDNSSRISSVNGLSHPQFSISPKFLTQGDIINSDGNGKIYIMNPAKGGGEILTIDFTDALHPHDFTDALHPELTPAHCKCEKEPLPVRCQKQPPVDTGQPHPVN